MPLFGRNTSFRRSDSAFFHRKKSLARDTSYETSLSDSWRRRSMSSARGAGTSLTDVSRAGITPVGSVSSSGGRKILNFLQKGLHLKRTKSVTKLDRRKSNVQETDQPGSSSNNCGAIERSLVNGQFYRSDECLLIASPESPCPLLGSPGEGGPLIRLASDAQIRAVHPSLVSGKRYCFQVTTTMHVPVANSRSEDELSVHSSPDQLAQARKVTRFYASQSGGERNRWISALKRTAKPNLEHERHRENSLRLWVQEAKNVSAKKRYFCEILLDRTLYARTTSKQMTEMLFWGEEFDLNNLPEVSTITLQLWREADPKKKKDRNQLIAFVTIPVNDVHKRNEVEQWYVTAPPSSQQSNQQSISTLTSFGSNHALASAVSAGDSVHTGCTGNSYGNPSTSPQIRMKARYQSVEILPLAGYTEILDFLMENSVEMMTALEARLGVKAKEDLAAAMVSVHQKQGTATEFLTDIVLREIDKLDNDNMAFRGNSMATKSMECYLKLVGEKYLQDTLSDFVQTVMTGDEECEVDPLKLSNSTHLARNQENLNMYVDMIWAKIVTSSVYFPRELRSVFSSIRSRMALDGSRGTDLCDHMISACIFLRYLCPAVLSPSLFGLTQEFPDEARIIRNFTLVAKSVQSLANFSTFGGKEAYMGFMNRFVEQQMETMRRFLHRISSPNGGKLSQPAQNSLAAVEALIRGEVPMDYDDAGPSSRSEEYIDLAYELAVIHNQLSDLLSNHPDEKLTVVLLKLKNLLKDIDYRLEHGFHPPTPPQPIPLATKHQQQSTNRERRTSSGNSSTLERVKGSGKKPPSAASTLSSSTISSTHSVANGCYSNTINNNTIQSTTSAPEPRTQGDVKSAQCAMSSLRPSIAGAPLSAKQIDEEWRQILAGVTSGCLLPPAVPATIGPSTTQSSSEPTTFHEEAGTVSSSGYQSQASPPLPLHYANPLYGVLPTYPPRSTQQAPVQRLAAPLKKETSSSGSSFPAESSSTSSPGSSVHGSRSPSPISSSDGSSDASIRSEESSALSELQRAIPATSYEPQKKLHKHSHPSCRNRSDSAPQITLMASRAANQNRGPPQRTSRETIREDRSVSVVTSSPSGPVKSTVRSDREKSSDEYEREIQLLRQQLEAVHSKLHKTQTQLVNNERDKARLLQEWQERLHTDSGGPAQSPTGPQVQQRPTAAGEDDTSSRTRNHDNQSSSKRCAHHDHRRRLDSLDEANQRLKRELVHLQTVAGNGPPQGQQPKSANRRPGPPLSASQHMPRRHNEDSHLLQPQITDITETL